MPTKSHTSSRPSSSTGDPDNCLAIDYRADSSQLMRQLSSLDKPAFLDSNSHASGQGRYDILSAAPAAFLQLGPGGDHCSDPEIEIIKTNIFITIKALRDKYLNLPENKKNPMDSSLPFTGGLIGYLGYPQLTNKSELMINEAFVAVYLWAVIVDHQQQCTHLTFHPNCPPNLKSELQRLLSSDADTTPAVQSFELSTAFSKQLSPEQYAAAFGEIKELIAAGDCYQVNLTQRVQAQISGSSLEAYLKLRKDSPNPFSAYLEWSNGALLSLSPERFLQKQGRQVLTQPIKGTRPRGNNPDLDQELADELRHSEKDRAENLMIVDLLRNDLGRVCELGSIKVNQLFKLKSFTNVHHLESSISGQLQADKDGLDLLESCFPGGSITGAPKLRAMEIIQALEPTPRRAYCGTVFYLGANGRLDSNITIRSLLREADKLYCWAGGGIVADSICSDEYQECFDKIDNLINALKPSPNAPTD